MWRALAILGVVLLWRGPIMPPALPVAGRAPPAIVEDPCPTTAEAAAAVQHQLDELGYGDPLADALDQAVTAWSCAHPGGPVADLAAWSEALVPTRPGAYAAIETLALDDDTVVAIWQHPDAVGGARLSVFSRQDGRWRRTDALALDGERATMVTSAGRRLVLFWEYIRTTGASSGGLRVGRVDAGRFETELHVGDLDGPEVRVDGDTVRVDHLRPPRSFGGGGKHYPSVGVALWLTISGKHLVTRETIPLSPLADLEAYCADPAAFRRDVPARVAWQLRACRFDVLEVTDESEARATVVLRRHGAEDAETLVLERSRDRYLPWRLETEDADATPGSAR